MIPIRRITRIILAVYAALTLYAILTVISGVGYHPILTPLNTLLAFSFAVLHGSLILGWRKSLLLLAITFGVSLLFESVGVATGWVYGSYHYTDKLGPKFLGLVPLLIPLAWFMMSYPSLILAQRLMPDQPAAWRWRLGAAGLGALVMTAWDFPMDPMMVAGGHWVWDQPGEYFGIPLHNYAGWWLTIFVAFGLFFWVSRSTPTDLRTPDEAFENLALVSYAVTGLSTIVVDFKIGLAGPALVGLFAMLPWIVLGWKPAQRRL